MVYIFFPALRDEMGYGMLAICEISLLLTIGYVKNAIVKRYMGYNRI